MADTLAHSPDSQSRASGFDLSQPFRGHPPALVFNRHTDHAVFTLDPDQRGFASRMTMNVGQAFLHQPEYEEFHFGGESAEVIGNLQVNRHTAALRKTAHKPTERG